MEKNRNVRPQIVDYLRTIYKYLILLFKDPEILMNCILMPNLLYERDTQSNYPQL